MNSRNAKLMMITKQDNKGSHPSCSMINYLLIGGNEAWSEIIHIVRVCCRGNGCFGNQISEEESNSGLQHQETPLLLPQSSKAITTVVTIATILKNNGLAFEKNILTSTVEMKDESKGRIVQKPKIEIVLGKTEKADDPMASAPEEQEADGDKKVR
ncbi:hypothetical protein MRB53_026945 [Persea americana]|uniref:Uncharacterized protein n=1 Tax=Persea americana TaxID=3435 RepID=A0ACC2LJN0_PERAE|nr:hypothetical protein MRB53_026945 [Persea americana]